MTVKEKKQVPQCHLRPPPLVSDSVCTVCAGPLCGWACAAASFTESERDLGGGEESFIFHWRNSTEWSKADVDANKWHILSIEGCGQPAKGTSMDTGTFTATVL